jgi:hypothetical protein
LVGVWINKWVRGASLVIGFHGRMAATGINAFSSPSLDHTFGSAFIRIFLIVHCFASDFPIFSTFCSMRISFPFVFLSFSEFKFYTPMLPSWLFCKSSEYPYISVSSRLASRAPQRKL